MTIHLTTTYLKDYTPSNYLIDTVDLIFVINETDVCVTSISKYYKNKLPSNIPNILTLDGSADLVGIELNDKTFTNFQQNKEQLILNDVPDKFTLKVITRLDPWHNQSCMGLYATKGGHMTQCEPQGFRKITYYPDRPDVMAIFTTTITANTNKYPILLSNGNKVQEKISDGVKTVTWHDPFKKPSYLFALVAGNFKVLRDTYKTKSGRSVTLEIYASEEDISRTKHAMQALKRAMRWDETRFNLEYDLDIFMIVISNDFNMGAMENKGLNIFNPKYVLGNSHTATDNDLIAIEAVIGHEYFHNWTGNRVTCRDWFQLSLKEGLTVFRDNEFTADLHGHGITRISEVNSLRQTQFTEDSSALAHSVRPESYVEMNNFYTATVYSKGQEVVRMYQTILGKSGFNEGLALYLKRHDGSYATCEDFCNAMSDANKVDLSQFMLWYSQAGTPHLRVSTNYNAQAEEYSIEFSQIIPDTLNQINKQPMLIPIKFGLLSREGKEIKPLAPISGEYVFNDQGLVLLLSQKKQKYVFNRIESHPIPSILRDFSAPVVLDFNYSERELIFLANYDSDEFNRYESWSKLLTGYIKTAYNSYITKQPPSKLSTDFISAATKLLADENLNPAFRALCLQLPGFNNMLTQIDNVNPKILYQAINYIAVQLGHELFDSWMELYNLHMNIHYDFNEHGKRTLKNTALFYIIKKLTATMNKAHSLQLIETMVLGQYHNSDNMTDTIAALFAVIDTNCFIRDEILQAFYNKYKKNELLMDKWFNLQAISSLSTIDTLSRLMVDKAFMATNPNKIYSLLGGFIQSNYKFHSLDGYNFVSEQIIMIDKFNPQLAGRLARGFSKIAYLHPEYKQLAKNILNNLINNKLSNDVTEIVDKIQRELS
ncbi:MAG: aminopeptidase [Burkholderiales bacterium]|jgi:aminopeptidase N|nr:aminopeptidase [Burkholderiales bacterium]